MTTVLLVDDNDLTQFISLKIMELSAIELDIICCKNGTEALEFISVNILRTEKLPDIILLDLNMPVMDGWEFLELYILSKQKIKKNIAVCILSSSMNLEDILCCRNNPAVFDYVVKPLTVEKFTSIVSSIKSLQH